MILHEIVDFCQEKLDINSRVKDYLFEKRKLTKDSITKFQIGFCPADISELFSKVDAQALREIGFIKDASHNYFSNRIIFPVWNQYNELVAIAGRILPEFFTGKMKYFNTLYSKGKILFGFNFAIPEVIRTSEVFVTEGHLDVVTAFQHNMTNVVGTCGTAFTFDHMMLLSRYAKNIKLLYDADTAGLKGAQRVLGKAYVGVNVQTVIWDKPGEDLDSYLTKYSAEALKRLISNNESELFKIRLA